MKKLITAALLALTAMPAAAQVLPKVALVFHPIKANGINRVG